MQQLLGGGWRAPWGCAPFSLLSHYQFLLLQAAIRRMDPMLHYAPAAQSFITLTLQVPLAAHAAMHCITPLNLPIVVAALMGIGFGAPMQRQRATTVSGAERALRLWSAGPRALTVFHASIARLGSMRLLAGEPVFSVRVDRTPLTLGVDLAYRAPPVLTAPWALLLLQLVQLGLIALQVAPLHFPVLLVTTALALDSHCRPAQDPATQLQQDLAAPLAHYLPPRFFAQLGFIAPVDTLRGPFPASLPVFAVALDGLLSHSVTGLSAR
jgi:hypothetical protein